MRLTNPLATIQEWYDAQAVEIRETIAFFIIAYTPGLESTGETDDSVATMRKWLEPGQTDDRMQIVGKTIMCRALIEYTCRNHFTKEGWGAIGTRIAFAKDYLTKRSNERLAESASKMIERLPFRSAQWRKAGEAWQTLCVTALADGALKAYEVEGRSNRQ